MADRYFSEQIITASEQTITLVGDEAHHLSNVMRAKIGDEFTVFDGRGADWSAKITRIEKRAVQLQVLAEQPSRKELQDDLTIAVALPRGDRQKWLIEKCVELGVARLIPLMTDRGVAQPVESAIDRLNRQVLEATKQCGRAKLLKIDTPQNVIAICKARPAENCFFAQPQDAPETLEMLGPNGGDASQWMSLVAAMQKPGSRICLIGPEGGFSSQEFRTALDAKWDLLYLGPYLLRVETAALQIASGHLQIQSKVEK
jgi:16S rRNA (uracil1498-N3)-methyltransferase